MRTVYLEAVIHLHHMSPPWRGGVGTRNLWTRKKLRYMYVHVAVFLGLQIFMWRRSYYLSNPDTFGTISLLVRCDYKHGIWDSIPYIYTVSRLLRCPHFRVSWSQRFLCTCSINAWRCLCRWTYPFEQVNLVHGSLCVVGSRLDNLEGHVSLISEGRQTTC